MRLSESGNSRSDRLQRLLASLFPRCQILIRSDGRLRHLTLSRRLHTSLAALLFLIAGWTVFATVQFIDHAATLAEKDRQIDANRVAYRGLLTDVAAYQERFFAIAQELEENQQLMLDLVERSATLQRALSTSKVSHSPAPGGQAAAATARERLLGELGEVESRLAEVAASNARLHERLANSQVELADVLDAGEQVALSHPAASRHVELMEQEITGMRDYLRSTLAERSVALSQNDIQSRHIAMLEAQLARTQAAHQDVTQQLYEHVSVHRQDVDGLRSSLLAALGERDRSLFDQRRMDERIRVLEDQIASIQELQKDAVQRLKEQTAQHIDNLEKLVGLTGLSLGSLIGSEAERQGNGQGGPFIAIEDGEAGEDVPGERMVASLNTLGQQIDHWGTLQNAMRRVPIAAPLRTYQVNSDFGKRVDPLNKMWAMHLGIDLGGPANAPVLATAPGVVTFVGWKGRYGNVVEIDHGAGIATLYAHLDSIKVKAGQRVGFQQQVGVLGDSGRSTGTHLHYEVTFKGKPMDPMKFIKAGQYVFQDSQKKR